MKLKYLIVLILASFAFVILFIQTKFDNITNKKTFVSTETYKTICGEYKKGEIKTGSITLPVDIADDSCKQTLGLSGKASLNNDGMLFIFENAGNYGFWMKDMNFPLDIIWINSNFEIVGIEKDLYPETFPKLFGQNYFAKYVLEISAGNSQKNNINIGDKIIFFKK